MKKGDSHADWAISMGLFLVAIMLLLMILKPGFNPEHKVDVLSNIIEEGFKENVSMGIQRIPIYVKVLTESIKSGTYVLDFTIENFPVDDDNRFFTILDRRNEILNQFSINGGKNKEIRLRGYIDENDMNVFYIIYTPRLDHQFNDPGEQTLADSDYILTIAPISRNKGIYQIWVSDLSNLCKTDEGYQSLKSLWDYPPTKEFEIYMDNDKLCNKAEPSDQDDIFVRNWKDIKVDQRGIDIGTVDLGVRTW
ncbi:MAG: hypothetical protein PHG05_03040 [Candidatus Nanoarchaeia archaeon]|nr:hypothetical protein [Candidatus Nanoarchaeia archaeon]